MRNIKVKTSRLLASLVVPMLFACGGEGTGGDKVLTIPQCANQNEGITVKNGEMVCEPLPNGVMALQDCPKYTHAVTSENGTLVCDFRNNESQQIRDALKNLSESEKLINDYTTRLGKLTPGMGARATYCGLGPTTKGKFTSGTAVGIAAASLLCSQVQACGSTGRLCSVYDMYNSVVTGALVPGTTLAKAWVYMPTWQNVGVAGVQEPEANLADNCGSYTYDTADRTWWGTAVKWEPATGSATSYTLKFYTGANDTRCGSMLPIACCH